MGMLFLIFRACLSRCLAAACLLWFCSACAPDPSAPGLIVAYTFKQLEPGRPVGFDLELEDRPVLLFRTTGEDTAIEVRLTDGAGTGLSRVRLPYLRAGPLFQVVDLGAIDGPAHLEIVPVQTNRDATVRVRVWAMPDGNRKDARRLAAYRSYEAATQATDDESSELWQIRADSLRSAMDGLDSVGERSAARWAEYLLAYVHYFPLYDYAAAIQRAGRLAESARDDGQDELEMLALKLEGLALIERSAGDDPDLSVNNFERAQAVLGQAAVMAARLDRPYQAASAVGARGIGYFNMDRFQEAGEMYRKALAISAELEDDYLHYLMEISLALNLEKQGDFESALEIFLEIDRRLDASTSPADQANVWIELGRIHQKLFLFPEAVDYLNRGIRLSESFHSGQNLARSRSSLAHAYFGMGHAGRALEIMQKALEEMQDVNYGKGLQEGFRMLADIHRAGARFAEMKQARSRQAGALSSVRSRAAHRYSLGLDALAEQPGNTAAAAAHFEAAGKLAQEAGDEVLSLRADLQACLRGADASCDLAELESRLSDWLPMTTPPLELEMRGLYASLLRSQGQGRQAIRWYERLVDDVLEMRARLPGVLGAWFWESRSSLFRDYLDLLLTDSVGGRSDLETLYEFGRLSNVGRFTSPVAVDARKDSSREMRILLARLESATPEDRPAIRQEIDRRLIQEPSRHSGAGIDSAGQLEAQLLNLPPDSALLAYYLGKNKVHAWIGTARGVRRVEAGDAESSRAEIRAALDELRVSGSTALGEHLEALGRDLVAPLAEELPRRILLLANGELSGLPLEVVRYGGRNLGRDHEILNLMSFDGLGRLRNDAPGLNSGGMVLAGDPDNLPEAMSPLMGSRDEIEGIAALFPGRQVSWYTGGRFSRALLDSAGLAEAGTVHFASHAEIDLEFPELSRLVLSGTSPGGGNEFLTPRDFDGLAISADLIVMSACRTAGANPFTFDSNLGFVSTLLRQGANAVVASLWPVSDRLTRAFMIDFYTGMAEGMAPSTALAEAKRLAMARGDDIRPAWAAFQIYLP
jgi:CHAT domain-containing protein